MFCENLSDKTVTVVKSSLVIMLLWLVSCNLSRQEEEIIVQDVIDLSQIQEKGTLVVATNDHSVDYFIYKGEPMGFQYEILRELGQYLGVKVEIVVADNFIENVRQLADGDCDMIASDLPLSERYQRFAVNSKPLYMARQVLVQRKPRKLANIGQELIRDPEMLDGKMVYTSGWSALVDDDFVTGRNIRMTQLKNVDPEELIRLVASGELDYAMCEESVARLIASQYSNIDIQTVLGDLPMGWMIRPTSPHLLSEINQWLDDFVKTRKYAVLYNKYHDSKRYQSNKLYVARSIGTISKYDDLFKKYSENIDWDWRLLAALVCQESRFLPDAKSRRGAYGLMQMMPENQERYGIDSTSSPEKHIAAGVAYIKYLDNLIAQSVPDKNERVKFVLASYNIGPGHILDAQRLAQKYGKDAQVWDGNVDEYLLSKSAPEYYNDPEVRHGRCLGKETYAFVNQIMDRYAHYKNIVE